MTTPALWLAAVPLWFMSIPDNLSDRSLAPIFHPHTRVCAFCDAFLHGWYYVRPFHGAAQCHTGAEALYSVCIHTLA